MILAKEVKIVKEVISCDVSPVVMFLDALASVAFKLSMSVSE